MGQVTKFSRWDPFEKGRKEVFLGRGRYPMRFPPLSLSNHGTPVSSYCRSYASKGRKRPIIRKRMKDIGRESQ